MTNRLDDTYYGWNAPFVGGLQGVMTRQSGQRLIKNDLLQLLLTLPGERIMRPDFGTRLRAVVFENLTDIDLELLADELRQQIATQDPRVVVHQSSVTRDDNRHGLLVRLVVSLRVDPSQQFSMETFIAGPADGR